MYIIVSGALGIFDISHAALEYAMSRQVKLDDRVERKHTAGELW